MSDRTYVRIEDMKALDGESFDQLKVRHAALNVGLVSGRPAVRVRKSFDNAYRPDLSRFPGDPDAFVSGPKSLDKLIEKRKRAGWVVGKPGSLADVETNSLKEGTSAETLFNESLRESKQFYGET